MTNPDPRQVHLPEGTYTAHLESVKDELRCRSCDNRFWGVRTFKVVNITKDGREIPRDDPAWQRAADQAAREAEGRGDRLCARCEDTTWDNAP